MSAARDALHEYKINSQGYKEVHGHWSLLNVPEDLRVNAIHAALLRTGKVLIIAGSGNDRRQFDAGQVQDAALGPGDRRVQADPHAERHVLRRPRLPARRQAADRRRHKPLREARRQDITHAAGVMTIKNESPDGGELTLDKGTKLVSPDGQPFHTTNRSSSSRPHKTM